MNGKLKITEGKFVINSQLYIKDYKDEITRLNNIINELEKWLEDKQKETILSKRDFSEDRIDIQVYNSRIYALNDCIDKLKELKGSDKE